MATYKRQRYLFMVIDPVHVGTGGYRLGRVDNSIVREPGTRIPKIPGTSLHGAARAYAAQLYENPEAAGQSQKGVDNPDKDPVCYTFGYIKPDATQVDKIKAYSGVVNIFDAHILAFPVYSVSGPVWVSSYQRLKNAGFDVNNPEGEGEQKSWNPPEDWDSSKLFLTWQRSERLNLGWLMLEVSGQVTVMPPENWAKTAWQEVTNRLVLIQEALFSQVVNNNLEVRTSVAIDPRRGAAEEGALFTYEAIPRATFLTADVVLDDYREDWPLKTENDCRTTFQNNNLPGDPWKDPLAVVKAGLRMIEWLGVGGMGTRGFGRMAVMGNPMEEEYGKGDGDE